MKLTIFFDGSSDEDLGINATARISNLKKLRDVIFGGLINCADVSLQSLSEVKSLESIVYGLKMIEKVT